MSTINRTTQQEQDRKMIAAAQTYLANQTAIVIAGVPYTLPEIVALIQHDVAVADAATNARAAFLAAAAAAKAQRRTMKPFLIGLKSYVENQFTDPSTIAAFGFSPRKATAPSAATKALAVNKREATRQARHTLGKNQKKAIKGAVPLAGPVASGTPAPPATPPSPVTPEPVTAAPVPPTPPASP
jgi:hypothetical protein